MIRWIRALDRVLKGEVTKPAALRTGTIDIPVAGVTTLLVLLGAAYGCCMGAFAVVSRWGGPGADGGWLQLMYSAAKVPMLFFLTLLITLPSLYVFNALVGCQLAFSAVVRLLIAALGVTLAVLASFGTIVVFFSLCSTSYPFMVLLNVLMFAVSGVLGMNFLLQTLHRLAVARSAVWLEQFAVPVSPVDPNAPIAPPPLPELGPGDRLPGSTFGRPVKTVFAVWVLVFGLIGAQMGWVLRPFIGAPSAPVTFFRAREGNFFQAVADKLEDLVGPPASGAWRGSPTTR
jgi:hypothetical protein